VPFSFIKDHKRRKRIKEKGKERQMIRQKIIHHL
jgi:hypothetical protein